MRIAADALYRQGDATLFNHTTGCIAQLNATGAFVIECVIRGIDMATCADAISKECSIDANSTRADVQSFINLLARNKFVEVDNETPVDAVPSWMGHSAPLQL